MHQPDQMRSKTVIGTVLAQSLARPVARPVAMPCAMMIAALIAALAIPLGAALGAQQASRSKSQTPSQSSSSHRSKPSSKPSSTASSKPSPKQAASPSPAPSPVAASSNDWYSVAVPSTLRDAPSSAAIGELQRTANVEVIAHDHGWSRVRIEGWIPDSALTPADTTFRAGLSAADLRADPDAARGKMVMWNVEFLALQTADPLRHGLADEEPYILARGPNSENALLYLVVPPSLMGTARALQPLSKIAVTARVRDGRSDPVGIPILDIQTIRRIR